MPYSGASAAAGDRRTPNKHTRFIHLVSSCSVLVGLGLPVGRPGVPDSFLLVTMINEKENFVVNMIMA